MTSSNFQTFKSRISVAYYSLLMVLILCISIRQELFVAAINSGRMMNQNISVNDMSSGVLNRNDTQQTKAASLASDMLIAIIAPKESRRLDSILYDERQLGLICDSFLRPANECPGINDLPPCPPTAAQAQMDSRYKDDAACIYPEGGCEFFHGMQQDASVLVVVLLVVLLDNNVVMICLVRSLQIQNLEQELPTVYRGVEVYLILYITFLQMYFLS